MNQIIAQDTQAEQISSVVVGAAQSENWSAQMQTIAEEDGYFEPLGSDHFVFFAESSARLLVTFERVEELRDRKEKLPAVWSICKTREWSLLTIFADGPTFWRSPEVWRYFDRLADDGFFEDFDEVLFYGAHEAGYAAAAYMVSAPGARALLISPIATADPRITSWDQRYMKSRRLDFTSRYGYAPDMIDAADKVWVVYDPQHREDAAHAALYRKPWVQLLRAPYSHGYLEQALRGSGFFERILASTLENRLSERDFSRAWRRTRRTNGPYLRHISYMLQQENRPLLERMVCNSITKRMKAPRYAKRLTALNAQLSSTQAP